MSDADPHDMSTAELTAKVMELHEKLNEQQRERHKLNTAMGSTLLSVGTQLLGVEAAVTKLGGDVQTLSGMVGKLSDRMLGNESMQTVGLVAEVNTIRMDVDGLKRDRLKVVTLASFIGAIGAAVISWLVAHWPFSGPKP